MRVKRMPMTSMGMQVLKVLILEVEMVGAMNTHTVEHRLIWEIFLTHFLVVMISVLILGLIRSRRNNILVVRILDTR